MFCIGLLLSWLTFEAGKEGPETGGTAPAKPTGFEDEGPKEWTSWGLLCPFGVNGETVVTTAGVRDDDTWVPKGNPGLDGEAEVKEAELTGFLKPLGMPWTPGTRGGKAGRDL